MGVFFGTSFFMQNNDNDLIYWNGLSCCFCERPDLYKKIIQHSQTAQQAWNSDYKSLVQFGFSESQRNNFFEKRKSLDLHKQFSQLENHGAAILPITDLRYPSLLKEISYPPQALYVKGEIDILNEPLQLACVGSRKMTLYGKSVIHSILKPLIRAGFTIVSGLAFGIDSACHEETLNEHGKTIAVLGSGLDDDHIYPATHRGLGRKIFSNGGALLSEYPPGTSANPRYFPLRNRIIAGLTMGTLVIEAAKKSGSLITAFSALSENRDVFAIPGNIDQPLSEGTNMLIAKGAAIVQSSGDIMTNYGINIPEKEKNQAVIDSLPSSEKHILNALIRCPLPVDKLFELSTLTIMDFQQHLLNLEFQSLIQKNGDMISLTQ